MHLAITIFNCYGWTIYGILVKDLYVCVTNFPGFLLGIFYCISALDIASQGKTASDEWKYLMLRRLLTLGITYFAFLTIMVTSYIRNSERDFGVLLVAWSSIFCAVAYYATPCTSVLEILRTKNSSSLYPPLLMANGVNSLLWLLYGYYGVNDPFIYGPNLLGVAFTFFQGLLACIYKSQLSTKHEIPHQYGHT